MSSVRVCKSSSRVVRGRERKRIVKERPSAVVHVDRLLSIIRVCREFVYFVLRKPRGITECLQVHASSCMRMISWVQTSPPDVHTMAMSSCSTTILPPQVPLLVPFSLRGLGATRPVFRLRCLAHPARSSLSFRRSFTSSFGVEHSLLLLIPCNTRGWQIGSRIRRGGGRGKI
jgi:hypothetical protein